VIADAVAEDGRLRFEYVNQDGQPSTRLVEPYSLERELPNWYVHTWDRTSDGPRSFRLDRMRSAKVTRERFEPREGFEPTRLRDARTATLLYDAAIARWAIERGGRLLADGTAVRDVPAGSDEWLESEVLSLRGEAVLLEPDELRHSVAARAKTLAKELGVERMRSARA
jgi:predicted DNA-binding transcriptional regulator YafY